jgi:hypothetical protein
MGAEEFDLVPPPVQPLKTIDHIVIQDADPVVMPE